MTIKVQHEALEAIQSQQWPIPGDVDECLSLRFRKPSQSGALSCHHTDFQSPVVEKQQLSSAVSIDDEDSVYTSSTVSFSDNESDFDRRVTFSEDLVTEVWTRPYTEKEDVPSLYYSNDETQRFRQEYRMERKLLSTFSTDSMTGCVGTDDISSIIESANSSSCSRSHRNGISRVVVLHNDRLETFCSSLDTGLSSLRNGLNETPSTETGSTDFFDTPEFWSGSITWW